MIVLDYQIAQNSPETADVNGLASANEDDLRYSLFLGDIVFLVGGCDFSARWGWVPVLDFSAGLVDCLSGLLRGGRNRFEFTESDASIDFDLNEDVVTIGASYVGIQAHVPYKDVMAAAEAFHVKVAKELADRYPSLLVNPAFCVMAGPARIETSV